MTEAEGYVLDKTPCGTDLVVTGDWSSGARDCLMDGRATGLVLNYARGYRERSLEFIRGLPIIRLDVLARTLKDLSPVYDLGLRLKSLSVQSDPRAKLDLSRLPLLESLSAEWAQIEAFDRASPKLNDLFLLSYLEPDLSALGSAINLSKIAMKDRPRLRSLDGLQNFPWLTKLAIFGAHHLTDVAALETANSPIMEHLELQSCKRIDSIDVIARCMSLRFFNFSECGEIPSLKPLAALNHLETLWLYGSTKVLDGDLSPLLGLESLKELLLKNRREYRPTARFVEDFISKRQYST